MKRKFIFPALMLCLGILNGCGAARPSKFYQLTVPSDRTQGADPAPYPVTLLLGQITSSRLYRDDRIVYTSNGQAMGTYEYHRWAEPPSDMINDVLLRELQASGRYEHVYSLRSDVRGDYLLRGRLYDFREIYGNGLVVRVAFEFELCDSRTATTVWTRYYSHDEAVDGKAVIAVVAAMDRNVQNGLSEVAGGLDQYFSTHAAVASQVPQSPARKQSRTRGPTIQDLKRNPEPVRGSRTKGANPPSAWDQL
jgi:cholesterol transport system auxiliary component